MISKAGEEPRRPFPKVVALLVLASAPFLCFVLIAQGTPTKIASLICGVSAAFAMLTFVYVRLRANRRGEKRQRFVASEEGRAKMRTLLQSRGFNSKEDIVAIFPDKAGSSLVVGSLLYVVFLVLLPKLRQPLPAIVLGAITLIPLALLKRRAITFTRLP